MSNKSGVLFFDKLKTDFHVSLEHVGIDRFENIRSNTPRNEFPVSSDVDNDIVHLDLCVSARRKTTGRSENERANEVNQYPSNRCSVYC